ncbi:MAG: ATP-binding cassette domain-containing protein [Gammaproteobacteria bacterium]|nr:ATP-binding cassette domain-containing protein [Gammaproteobacteria bacterium]
MIKVEKLNKYYKQGLFKKLHVINNTTLEIPKSGIIAVVGKSGVGKTTLLNTISGLDNFKNGTISFNEEKTDHYDSKFADKLRMEHFGFVFQNYYLLKDRSVYDNVNLSLDSFKLTEDEKKERINYVLKQLGISKYTNKLVSNLSGGEQQRVSIARALVKSPKVIFADEPTGSLDEMTTFTVLNILKKVSKNCAVFIVTHEKELISYYADYIIELDHGVIVKEFVPENKTINGLAVDQNIYLDELKRESEYKDSNVELNLFSDSSVNKDIKINVAIKNSKIYLESSEEIIYLDKNSEAKMLKGERRKIQDYVDNDFNFELPPIEYNKNKNNFNTIFKKSFNNLRIKSSFKTLLRVVLVLLSVILVLLFESIKQLKNKDLSMVVSASQGNIYVSVSPNAYGVGSSMLSEAYQNLRIEIENLGDDKITTMFASFEALNFSYEGFYQYKKKMYNLKVYDFKPISYLNQKDLIYGRMPEKRS